MVNFAIEDSKNRTIMSVPEEYAPLVVKRMKEMRVNWHEINAAQMEPWRARLGYVTQYTLINGRWRLVNEHLFDIENDLLLIY